MDAGEAGVAPQCGKQWSEAAGLLCELLALLPPPGAQASAAPETAPATDVTPAASCSGGGGGGGSYELHGHLQPWPGFSGAVFSAWRQLLRLAAARPYSDAASGNAAKQPAQKRQRVAASNSSAADHGESAACSAAHIAVLQFAGAEAGLPATAPKMGGNSVAEAQDGAEAAAVAAAQPLQPTAAAFATAAAQCMALAARHLTVCCGTSRAAWCAAARGCSQRCMARLWHCRAWGSC